MTNKEIQDDLDPPDVESHSDDASKSKATKKSTKKSTTSTDEPEGEGEASYVIAAGKCVAAGNRGHLTEGASISAADFHDGELGLLGLLKAGYVVIKQ